MCATSYGYLSNETLCFPFWIFKKSCQNGGGSINMILFKGINIGSFSKCWKEVVGVTPTFLEYQEVAGIAQWGVAARVAQECSLRCVLVHCLGHPSYIVRILGHWCSINRHRSKCVKITQYAGKASVLQRTQQIASTESVLKKGVCLWTVTYWTIPNLMWTVFLVIYFMILSDWNLEPIKEYPYKNTLGGTLPRPLTYIQRCNIHDIS